MALICQSTIQESLTEQTVSRQDMTMESAISDKMEQVLLNALGYMEKGTGKHQSNTVYDSEGLSPTLSAVNYKEPEKVIECKKIGQL